MKNAILFLWFWKQLIKKAKVNFKIYDVKAWITKILQYIYCLISQEKRQPDNEFGTLIEYNRRNIFLEK